MNPIRRELLNGVFVLVVASLMSVAFAAFQVNLDVQLWVLILMGIAIAISGYVVFEVALRDMASTEDRELRFMAASEVRETEWLKRVGTPARLELNRLGSSAASDAITESMKAISPSGDYTVMYYFGADGGVESPLVKESNAVREKTFSSILERLKLGTLREYKRIVCFDHDVLANDHELKSGVLRVGEGPGTIDRRMGDHCRAMMQTKGCSLYVAPAVLRSAVSLYGADKASISVEMSVQETGGRMALGVIFFCDPPNGEIIEQLRQLERETERHMVAVHKIRFPEDAEQAPQTAVR